MNAADTTWGQAISFYRQGLHWQAHQWVQLVARVAEGKCEPGGRIMWLAPELVPQLRPEAMCGPVNRNVLNWPRNPCAQGWER